MGCSINSRLAPSGRSTEQAGVKSWALTTTHCVYISLVSGLQSWKGSGLISAVQQAFGEEPGVGDM